MSSNVSLSNQKTFSIVLLTCVSTAHHFSQKQFRFKVAASQYFERNFPLKQKPYEFFLTCKKTLNHNILREISLENKNLMNFSSHAKNLKYLLRMSIVLSQFKQFQCYDSGILHSIPDALHPLLHKRLKRRVKYSQEIILLRNIWLSQTCWRKLEQRSKKIKWPTSLTCSINLSETPETWDDFV